MNRFQTPRSTSLAAFAGAAVMTLATLLGVGQLAQHSSTEMQMAHAAESAQQVAQGQAAQPKS